MTAADAPNRFARAERDALCDTFLRLGPDVPTLCEGWVSRDLAAHLVVREGRNLFASLGIFLGPFAGLTRRATARATALEWPALVDQVRQGPPRGSMMRNPKVDGASNTVEFFVHHEDVLRAQPDAAPRAVPDDLADALWDRTPMIAKRLAKGAPARVVLQRTDGRRHELPAGDAPADRVVTVVGEPGEIVMWLFRRVGDVRVDGEQADVAAVAAHLARR